MLKEECLRFISKQVFTAEPALHPHHNALLFIKSHLFPKRYINLIVPNVFLVYLCFTADTETLEYLYSPLEKLRLKTSNPSETSVDQYLFNA